MLYAAIARNPYDPAATANLGVALAAERGKVVNGTVTSLRSAALQCLEGLTVVDDRGGAITVGGMGPSLAELDSRIERQPTEPAPLLARALLRFQAGEDRDAMADLTKAIHRAGHRPPYFIVRPADPNATVLTGADEGETPPLRHPNRVLAHQLRAFLLYLTGDLAGSLEVYNRAAQINQADWALWVGAGLVQLKASDPGAAQQSFRQARRYDPASASAHTGSGLAQLQSGENPSAAVRSLSESLRLYPDNPAARYALGLAYRQKGDSERTQTHFTAACKMNYQEACNVPQ
jgi:tetratricopeptide (TPR) repeat protein